MRVQGDGIGGDAIEEVEEDELTVFPAVHRYEFLSDSQEVFEFDVQLVDVFLVDCGREIVNVI